MKIREYKNLKGLKKENLRDNMSDLELVLTMLAEATTTELSKTTNPQNFQENVEVAKKGDNIAGDEKMTKESFTPRKTRKQLNMFYVKHTLLVISETLNEGGCISGNESTISF